jgi:hypothetical protein
MEFLTPSKANLTSYQRLLIAKAIDQGINSDEILISIDEEIE